MIADELMIGDWVRLTPGVPTADKMYLNKAVKVAGLNDDDGDIKVWIDIEESPLADYWSEDENDFEPIPLTDEILLKNGWLLITTPNMSEGTIDTFRWPLDSDIEMPFALERGYDGNKFWMTAGIGGLVTPINYVHRLQQLFRLCGLTKLADNFKI